MPRNHKCKAKGCNNTVDRTYSSTTQVCSVLCAVAWGREKGAKKANKGHREDKRRLRDNDRSFQLKKAQTLFNRYIRLRDDGNACISCGRFHAGQIHAGHYRSIGANPELRFDEFNCHLQCAPCNNHLSGNIADYRIGLVRKLGIRGVECLEGKHERPKLTIDDIKAVQDKYKAKIKEIKNAQSDL